MNISDNKSRTEKVCGIRLPELEGRVRIELRDARTGHLDKVVEGKNLVTNAVRDIFASNYFGALDYSKLMPIYKEMFGGVLLFDELLTEDADGYAIPNKHTHHVIGHAGQSTYVPETEGIDDTRGNPIFSASGFTTHGFRHVWEFGASQAVGTIKSLALCHKDTGSYWLKNGIREFNPYIEGDGIETTGQKPAPLFFDQTNHKAYTLSHENSTVLTIQEHSYAGCVSGIGLTQVYPGFEDTDTQNMSTHTVTLPNKARDYFYLYRPGYIDAIYANGTKVWKSVISLSDYSVSTTEYTNSTSNFANMNNSGASGKLSDYGLCRAITIDDDGYLYLAGADKKTFYKLNYSTMQTVQSAARSSAVSDSSVVIDPIQGIGHFGVQIGNGIVFDYDTVADTYAEYYIYGSGGYRTACIASSPDNGMVQFFPTWKSYASGQLIKNRVAKLFMSTIKNLESPYVVKTATQAMTVTYTITEVLPE